VTQLQEKQQEVYNELEESNKNLRNLRSQTKKLESDLDEARTLRDQSDNKVKIQKSKEDYLKSEIKKTITTNQELQIHIDGLEQLKLK